MSTGDKFGVKSAKAKPVRSDVKTSHVLKTHQKPGSLDEEDFCLMNFEK
jgi:hypothetical protein